MNGSSAVLYAGPFWRLSGELIVRKIVWIEPVSALKVLAIEEGRIQEIILHDVGAFVL